MSIAATVRAPRPENFSGGLASAIVLHLAVAGAIILAALINHWTHPHWGGDSSQAGEIQASLVNALPAPTVAPPVEKNVLVQPDVSKTPAPPPKEATQPPPKPTDILVKNKTTPTKPAPVPTPTPPKHPQPVPDTTKANTGSAATQIPQAIVQTKNGTAALTVQNHTFGVRYAYYLDAVQRIISQSWQTQEADPRTSVGKSVKVIFDINADGAPMNVRIETPSGSPTLDASAIHALQRVDGFGPLPAGNVITVEDTFNYHQ